MERAETYYVEVDDREGPTRGYSLCDELEVTGNEPQTRVVEAVDSEGFTRMMLDLFRHEGPHYSA